MPDEVNTIGSDDVPWASRVPLTVSDVFDAKVKSVFSCIVNLTLCGTDKFPEIFIFPDNVSVLNNSPLS